MAEPMFAVTITTEPTLIISEPRQVLDLFKLKIRWITETPDGRFLVIQRDEREDAATQINVVLNWFEELKRRVSSAQ
jgi:hypothetical protein